MNTHSSPFAERESQPRQIPQIICKPPTPVSYQLRFGRRAQTQTQNARDTNTGSLDHPQPFYDLPSIRANDSERGSADGYTFCSSSEGGSPLHAISSACSSLSATHNDEDATALALPSATALQRSDPVAPLPTPTVAPSRRKPRKRHPKPGHIPRPRNAFILFRSHAVANGLITQDLSGSHCKISRIISHMWKSLDEVERRAWDSEAEAEKAEHGRKYPNYKYQPKIKSKRRAKQPRTTDAELERECEEAADSILKAHGRSGILKDEDGRPRVSRTAEIREARNAAHIARLCRRTASEEQKRLDALAAQRKRNFHFMAETAKLSLLNHSEIGNSAPEEIRSLAKPLAIPDFTAVTAGDLATSIPGEFYHEGVIKWPTHVHSHAMNGSPQYGSLPAQLAFETPLSHTARESLFGSWQERLNLASSGSSDSPSGSLRQTDQRKERPQPFQLLAAPSSMHAIDGMPISPMSIPLCADGSSQNFVRRPETAFPLTPRYNSWTGHDSNIHVLSDKMLVSPLRSSFSDMRKYSIGWPNRTRASFQKRTTLTLSTPSRQVMQSRPSADLALTSPRSMTGEVTTSLFEEAAMAAVASLNAHSSVDARNGDDVFAFQPDFLNDAELSPNRGSAISLTDSRPGTRNCDDDCSVAGSSLFSLMNGRNSQVNEVLANGGVLWSPASVSKSKWPEISIEGVNEDVQRRRSTIDGLKHTLVTAAASLAAEQSGSGGSDPSHRKWPEANTSDRAYSHDLLHRWHQSISAAPELQCPRMPSLSGDSHSENTSFPPTSAACTHVRVSSDSPIGISDSRPVVHCHDAAIDLPLALGFDFASLPIQWNLYGLNVDLHVDRDLLDVAFEELGSGEWVNDRLDPSHSA